MLYLVSCIYDFTAPGAVACRAVTRYRRKHLSPVVMSSWKWVGMGWYGMVCYHTIFSEKHHTGVCLEDRQGQHLWFCRIALCDNPKTFMIFNSLSCMWQIQYYLG